MQINERNFAWLGLDERTALDSLPLYSCCGCRIDRPVSLQLRLPDQVLPYAEAVSARIKAVSGSINSPASPTAPEEDVDLNDRPAGITTLIERGN